MTQPYAPLQGLPGFGGGTAPLTGLPGFAPQPAPMVPGSGGAPALPAAFQGQTKEAYDAANPATNVGAFETVATQAGRGLLDVVLGSGALAGAATQSLGAATGWSGLEDFGRHWGQASSGTAAMEAAAFLFGGGGEKGLSYAERTERAIQEQEQAWPMLSAVSRIGGGAALAFAAPASAGATGLRTLAAIGAYEGAASGVQQAYERNEALRDVLVSGLAGAAFGAAGGAAAHGVASIPGRIGAAIDERNTLRQVFGDIKTAADDVADAVRQAGGKETYEAAKTILTERARVLAEVAKAGDNPSLIRQAYESATHAAGERISKLAGDFDATSWATKTPSAAQKLLHRTPLLDRVSADLGDDVARLTAARPSLDFDLKVTNKLLKDADKTAAIGGLQSQVTNAIEQATDPRVRDALLDVSARLQTAGAGEAMALGHGLVRQLGAVAREAPDGITASYAQRQAQAIAGELSGEAWGGAGKAYGALARLDSPLDNLDPKALREALRHADSSRAIPGAFAEQQQQLLAGYAARKQLGGQYADEATRKLMKDATERAEMAHKAVTFDGAPAKRVLDILSGAGRNIGESYASDLMGMGVGMAIGGVPGMLVARALSPVLGEVASAAFGKSVAAAGNKAAKNFVSESVSKLGGAVKAGTRRSVAWQQSNYQDSIDKLTEAVTMASPEAAERQENAIAGLPPEIQAQASTDMQAKLGQLMQDIPKPQPNIRGKAWETLSSSDLRKAQAMWEATLEPMTVFQDFAAGNIDYDKVRYAWKQYPGLQQAAQAGLMDIITTQLKDDDRAAISDGMLTQLDNLFGFDGALQPTLEHGFSSRMSSLAQPEQSRPAPQSSGPLKLPTATPSYTERIAGARA